MIINFILLGVLTGLVTKWDKPLYAALIYSLLKVIIAATIILLIQGMVHGIVGFVFTLFLVFLIHMALSWLIAWLFHRYRGNTWTYVGCTVLAVPLLFL